MNQVLLVEGKDDLFVFANIFEKHKVEQTFKIESKDGIDSLLKSIPIYIKTDNVTIGVIVDADTNISNRWISIQNILEKLGYSTPSQLNKDGIIIKAKDLPNFGLWIMPNNKETGMLEDFIKHLIPSDDKLISFVDDTLKLLEIKKLNRYKENHKAKAKIHTWLAWQETPGTPMGLAINKSYLETHKELCIKFVAWTNKLYNN